jgi:hypothetical protein
MATQQPCQRGLIHFRFEVGAEVEELSRARFKLFHSSAADSSGVGTLMSGGHMRSLDWCAVCDLISVCESDEEECEDLHVNENTPLNSAPVPERAHANLSEAIQGPQNTY